MTSTDPGGRAHGSARPIFVLGFQRSGTTLLQSLLGAHPSIAAPPELHFWFRVALLGPAWGDLHDDRVLRRVVDEALHPAVPLLQEAGFDPATVTARAATGPRTWPAILDAIMTDFAERHGKPRWSEKSPGQPAGVVHRWFPDAQLVHIVRDPRDCIASNIAAPWGERDALVLARRWRRHTLDTVATGSRAGPDRYLRIRYEDLVADTTATLRVVFAFLDEPMPDDPLGDHAERRTALAPAAAPHQQRLLDRPAPADRPTGARERLVRARAAAATRKLLQPFGYDPVTPRALAAGSLANLLLLPRALPALGWAWRARRARRDPTRLPQVVADYQQRAARDQAGRHA